MRATRYQGAMIKDDKMLLIRHTELFQGKLHLGMNRRQMRLRTMRLPKWHGLTCVPRKVGKPQSLLTISPIPYCKRYAVR
jgi:hypothetical protein